MTHNPRADSALFTWHDDTTIVPGELRDNPRQRRCRYCGALPGDPCTRPQRGGRRALSGYHHARQVAP
jgi:hypothetical protein